MLLLDDLLLHRGRRLIEGIPERPLLAPWYRLVEEGKRMVFEHANRAVVLEGAAVRTLLPRLLPLLDGTRRLSDLSSTLGDGFEPAIEKALTVLSGHGLLVSGPPAGGAAELSATAEQLAASSGAAPAGVAAALSEARVGIAGGSQVAIEVARLLRRAGVGAIEPRRVDAVEVADALVVAAPTAEDLPRLAGLNDGALASSQPWLQVLPFDGRIVPVGPLFIPGDTACHACFRLRRAASLAFGEIGAALEVVPVRAPAGPVLEQLAAATAASLALAWLSVRDPRLPGVLYAIEPEGGPRVTTHSVLRVPRCPACSSADRLAPPAPWFDPEPEAEVAA